MKLPNYILLVSNKLEYTKFELAFEQTQTWFTLLFKKGCKKADFYKWLKGISKATNDLTFTKGMLNRYNTIAKTYLYRVSRLQNGNLEASERNEQLEQIELPLIDPLKVTPKTFLEFKEFLTNHYYSSDEKGKLIDKSNLSGFMRLRGGSDITFHYNYRTICDLIEGCVISGVLVSHNIDNNPLFVEGKCANLGDVKKLLRNHFGDVVLFS